MKKIILTLVAVSLLSAPVMAQETATPQGTPEAPSDAPEELEAVLDDNVALVDYSFDDGVLTLELYAERPTVLSLSAWPEDSSGASTSQFRVERIEEGTVTTISIETTEGVSISSAASRQAGRQLNVPAPSQSIIEGPYDGRDVIIAALAGAMAVGFAVLFGAAKLKYAGGKRGEQVA